MGCKKLQKGAAAIAQALAAVRAQNRGLSSRGEVQIEPRLGPRHGDEVTDARERDVGRVHIDAAEADIGCVDVRCLHASNQPAVGSNDSDRPADEGCDADVALGVHCEAVEAMIAGFVVEEAGAIGRRKRPPRDDARGGDVEGPKPSTLGLGNVKRTFVG
jgi:hypothetical protein